MMWGGLSARGWTERTLAEYFIVWFCLIMWTWSLGRQMKHVMPAMWASLNCGRPAFAVWRTSGLNKWTWTCLAINLPGLRIVVPGFPSGSTGELVFISWLAFLFLMGWLFKIAIGWRPRVADMSWEPEKQVWRSNPFTAAPGRCELRLIREFREIVHEPLPEASDPRFKKWNVRERFPWPLAFVQHQLHERLAQAANNRNPGSFRKEPGPQQPLALATRHLPNSKVRTW
jgi:hypothetical protein